MFYNSKFILSWKVMFSKQIQQWAQSSARHNVTLSSDISTQHAVGPYWVPGHAGVRGNETTDKLARGSSVMGFLGPEPALAVSRQDTKKKDQSLVGQPALVQRRGLGDTQRQVRELILGQCLGAKARFLSFNRTQSKAVTGFLTGHNTLRRHLHLLGLLDSPLCRRFGAEEETSARILCECEALASLRHAYLDSFFLEPQDIKFGGHLELQQSNRGPIN